MEVRKFLMKTQVDSAESVVSLTRGGQNTIRKFSKKYGNMRPGDAVLMEFVLPDGQIVSKEWLIVKSLAYGKYKNILKTHFRRNTSCLYGQLDAELKTIYGQDIENDQFLAIYF